MLVDDITLTLIAGNGGNGSTAFNKVRLNRGPTGGDGGLGASIYFEGIQNINALLQFAGRKEIKAEDGKNGRGQFLDGRRGENLILKVPVGTVITNIESGFSQEITEPGQRIIAVGGGVGGRGNFKFRGPRNTTPMQHEDGTPGDTAQFHLELKMIADVGLVGLPNAGKSSLLNTLTRAHSKVANYAFTTLEPHLGDYYGIILADVPGIIEGASEGKGLGVKFLRHVERTKIIFHLISCESEDPARDYKLIRKELKEYNPTLVAKPEFVFLTKSDNASKEEVAAKLKILKKVKVMATPISILDDESINAVRKILNEVKDRKPKKED